MTPQEQAIIEAARTFVERRAALSVPLSPTNKLDDLLRANKAAEEALIQAVDDFERQGQLESYKVMDLDEFRAGGFVMEVNRQLLHPLGLALAVVYQGDEATGMVVYDNRDDPEGFAYDDLDSPEAVEMAANVWRLKMSKLEARLEQFGYVVQPVPAWSESDSEQETQT